MKSGQFIVLGIYEVHMASAAIMVDGVVVAATHEERFSRIKNDCGFPYRAAQWCMEQAGVSPEDVDVVAMLNESFPPGGVANILFKRPAVFRPSDWVAENELYWKPKLVEGRDPGSYFDIMGGWDRVPNEHYYDLDALDMDADAAVIEKTFNELRRGVVEAQLGISRERVRFMPHYLCHHYHAYYSGTMRGQDVAIVHAEGDGGIYNSAVSRPTPQGLEIIAGTRECDLGRLYQWMTLLLGMNPYHHEYKLMGLAPHANDREIARSREIFDPIFRIDPDQMMVVYNQKPRDLYYSFRDALQGHRFDGIAGALQAMVEDRLCEWLEVVIEKTGCRRICYGGGVAMNVKANMSLWKVQGLREFFVPLSPGDESNIFGAGYLLTEQHLLARGEDPEQIPPIEHAYFGAACDDASIRDTARQAQREGFSVRENVSADAVAQLLAEGNVVARCAGRGEFGQRALGNRSILANPSVDRVVEKINHQIKYRDFWMPFAPSVLRERVDDYLVNPKDLDAPFMTVAFESRHEKRGEISQALHPADATARPQMVTQEANPGYHELIRAFEAQTGIGAVLNTSLNLHGEPIVNSAEDALHTFRESELDALWLEDCLITRHVPDENGE